MIFALATFSLACTRSDQERADADAANAKAKSRSELKRLDNSVDHLGEKAKREAQDLGKNINHALDSSGSAAGGDTTAASGKLRRGEQELRAAGQQAGGKLDKAALIAKVKAKLASDVGAATVTQVEVDVVGHLVTLNGTVSSQEQRRQAETAARDIDGVTGVVDRLRVQP